MARISDTPRNKVLDAIAECDALGVARFVEKHGYKAAKRWQLRFAGRSYPSKAILGAAAGLSCREFSGGIGHTVAVLRKLGFQIRTGIAAKLPPSFVDLARSAGLESESRIDVSQEPAAYFASGSNEPRQIRGLADAGHDIGVAAPEVGAPAEAELKSLAESDALVFCDSGAFSEVKFGPRGPEVVHPMTSEMWERVLGLYERLGTSLGSQLSVVAPDRVGCQDTTLERLAIYRDRIAAIADLGVRILVPIQRGALSQAEFAGRVSAILTGIEWVPAIPCRNAATSPEELQAFIAAIQPRSVHLLGIGPRSAKIEAYISALAGTEYTCDSNWIKSRVGREHVDAGGRKRKTEIITAAKDAAAALLAGASKFQQFVLAIAIALGV